MDNFKKLPKMACYKEGGMVKVAPTGDKKAKAPSEATKRPSLKGSDVEKEKSKPAGHKDPYIKSKDDVGSASAPSAAVKGRNKGNGSVRKFKTGGKIKKYSDGRSVVSDLANAQVLNRLKNIKKLGAGMQSQAMNENLAGLPNAGAGLANAGLAGGLAAPAATPAVQAPGGTSPAGAIPAQKRGGKVKRK